MPEEKETKPISVRLAPEVLERLDRVAEKSGLSRSSVIKVLVNSFLEKVGEDSLSGNTLHAWEDAIRDLDGRTHRYSKVAEKRGAYKSTSRRSRGKG